MSQKKKKGRESRGARRRRKRTLPNPGKRKRARTLWITGGVIVAALVLWAVGGQVGGDTVTHPEPRADVTNDYVVPPARFAQYERVADVYRAAERVAPVLDGLYCYCHCEGHAGHRSLLICFESDHAAACDVCLSQASVAYRMTLDGEALEAVRREVDDLFG